LLFDSLGSTFAVEMFNFNDTRIVQGNELQFLLQERQGHFGICDTGKRSFSEYDEGFVICCTLLQMLPVYRLFASLAGALSIND